MQTLNSYPFAARIVQTEVAYIQKSICKIQDALDRFASRCKSPIEVRLALEMLASWTNFDVVDFILATRRASGVVEAWNPLYRGHEDKYPRVTLIPQHRIEQYTADFALLAGLGDSLAPMVVVECDGHDYHERTKEQAAHDRARDRWMTAKGIRVLRFTGSQIHRDTAGCVGEIRRLVTSLLYELERGVRANG